MPNEFISVACDGRITTITLNRPHVMNAVNPQMHHELQSAFDVFAADDEQYVCVLTGAGDRAFCVGSDLKAPRIEAYPKNGYAGLVARFDLAKPVIAAVNGLAFGGGFEIALACDLIIASDTALFSLPEPLVGAMAMGGGAHRLVRQIGLKQAMGLLLTSRRVNAAEGQRLGFVNEVAAPAELLNAAYRWANEILRGAPLAIRATKQTAMRGLDEPDLEAAIKHQTGYPTYVAWWQSDDLKEGRKAFGEKRTPEWRGR